ncbi:MAG: thiamine pyrophosphate-binding protein [Candidatus Rokubacteria bacterium]|nr:thiamine pyrophosphate-binding protein [Candidatus Rokubacteria bacterium]
MSRTTVADVVADGLRRAGARRVFGVPGGGARSALLDAARDAGLPLVLAYGETAACVMAAVTGDLAEAPAAVFIGAGPGVAAAAAGLAHAVLDRSPMLLLTDRHPGDVLGCKASLAVEAASAGHWIAHAARLAMAEPRGPVHLDVPPDVATQSAVTVAASCRPDPLAPPDAPALDEAARLIAGAARPLLALGLHCRAVDAPWLRALAEALPAPVLATCRGKGAVPDPHPLVLGVVTGEAPEEPLVRTADLIVAIGLDPVEPVPASWWAGLPVLALGPAPPAGSGLAPAFEVTGGIAAILEELAPRLAGRARADWDVAALDRAKRAGPSRQAASAGFPRHRAVRIAREATEAGTLATADAGACLDVVAAAWDAVAPREFLASNARAATGFALPAAIAAHLVHPGRRIVCFTDPAGLTAASSELETAHRLRAPVVVVVFGGAEPVRLAQGFGLPAFAADSEASFAQALGRALGRPGPALIAVVG